MLKVAYADIYHHPLPSGHRFPMEKYSLLPEQLLYEGTLVPDNFFKPPKAQLSEVLDVHSEEYYSKLKNGSLSRQEERRLGFPQSKALLNREEAILGGAIETANFALQYGCSINIAGGTHHAFVDRGEGFCLLNDIAVAARYLLRNKEISKILVIDLDVHQGNGTAQIFNNDDRVFTFSMHGARNYPLEKERSNLDVELPDGIKDQAYLKLLESNLDQIFSTNQFDFVFYQSGVDIIETDKLGRLNVSKQGCLQRDKVVLELCEELQLPIAICMGGGYSPNIKDIVEAHANTYRSAQEIFF